MDNKLIKQFGVDILSYRLRTERQKKRAQYEDFEKYLIQLYREERELYQKKENLGWTEIVPPVQKGWKRFFVLRPDVESSRHADFFNNILNKINTYDWSYRKDFRVKRRRYGRKTYVVKTQKLLEPMEYHFNKLNFSEAEKQFFHIEHRTPRGSWTPTAYYVFSEPWRFVLRTKPNMIDKVRTRDEALEAELKSIHSFLERNGYRKKQCKILHGSCWISKYDVDEQYHDWDPFKNMPIRRILDETRQEIFKPGENRKQ